jgi:hypothetical protein
LSRQQLLAQPPTIYVSLSRLPRALIEKSSTHLHL